MIKCHFCKLEEFNNLDDVTLHQYTVNSQGQNICKKITYRIDPYKADNLFPMKINGRKYPPKNPCAAKDQAGSGRNAPSWPPMTYATPKKRKGKK